MLPEPHILRYTRWLREERGLDFDATTNEGYDRLWRWSCDDLAAFWQSIWDYFAIAAATPHACVLAEEKMPGAVWFPGAEVKIGGQGASDNRQIPVSEGGSIDPTTGKQTKAADFEGVGGPEDKAAIDREVRGGDNDIRDNIRQGGSTVRPAGSLSNDAAGGAGKSTQ